MSRRAYSGCSQHERDFVNGCDRPKLHASIPSQQDVHSIILLAVHQIKAAPLFGTLGLAFLTLFVSAITLRITMDADGLGQRWLWGRRRIAWHEIASIERVRRGIAGVGLFLLDEKGKEIFAVSALPFTDQQVIVDAALRYGRLRKDKKPPKRPIMERWMRK
jgi:hypothetical protein